MAFDLLENYNLEKKDTKVAMHINALRKEMVTEFQNALEYSRDFFSVKYVQEPSAKARKLHPGMVKTPHNEICN